MGAILWFILGVIVTLAIIGYTMGYFATISAFIASIQNFIKIAAANSWISNILNGGAH